MNVPTPQNYQESAYVALGLVDALIDLLVSKGVITGDDRSALIVKVVERFAVGGSHESHAASRFLADFVAREKDAE